MTDPTGHVVEPEQILRYGPHDDQRVEVSYPSDPPRGVVVLIHGGYWRAQFTAALMHPLVRDLSARGWLVANLEYRRGRDGWAATSDDLAEALELARGLSPDGRVTMIGHSVGGQLALLGARDGDAVVALAPVTDLVRGFHEGIGDDAVAEFFGAPPDAAATEYAAASPLAQVPPRGNVLVVHGADDARVPISHTRAYVDAAGAAVELLELPELSHLDAIVPSAPHWPHVHAWLERPLGAGGARPSA